MKKTITFIGFVLIILSLVLAVACNSTPKPTDNNPIQGKVIKSSPIGNSLTVTLSNDTGKLKNGEQEFMLAFTDASGKAVDVGAVAVNFHMPEMGTMAAMNDPATFVTTSVPGVYKGRVKIEMPGEWIAQISYEGKAGNGKTSIPMTAY
jgi:hypothetical protein